MGTYIVVPFTNTTTANTIKEGCNNNAAGGAGCEMLRYRGEPSAYQNTSNVFDYLIDSLRMVLLIVRLSIFYK